MVGEEERAAMHAAGTASDTNQFETMGLNENEEEEEEADIVVLSSAAAAEEEIFSNVGNNICFMIASASLLIIPTLVETDCDDADNGNAVVTLGIVEAVVVPAGRMCARRILVKSCNRLCASANDSAHSSEPNSGNNIFDFKVPPHAH